MVYAPDLEMVVDLVPCEGAHAQERTLMAPLLEQAQPDKQWIADRNQGRLDIRALRQQLPHMCALQ